MTIANKERYKQIGLALRAMCFQEIDKMFSRLENLSNKVSRFPSGRHFWFPFMLEEP